MNAAVAPAAAQKQKTIKLTDLVYKHIYRTTRLNQGLFVYV